MFRNDFAVSHTRFKEASNYFNIRAKVVVS